MEMHDTLAEGLEDPSSLLAGFLEFVPDKYNKGKAEYGSHISGRKDRMNSCFLNT